MSNQTLNTNYTTDLHKQFKPVKLDMNNKVLHKQFKPEKLDTRT